MEIQLDSDSLLMYTYTGQYKSGKRYGMGDEVLYGYRGDTLTYYRGFFADGMFRGEVLHKQLLYPVQIHYRAEFRDGSFHGEGEMKKFTHEKLISDYRGNLLNSKQHGYGVNQQGSNKYEGYWKDGKREGNGKMYFNDLLIYDGGWRNDRFNGIGKRFYPDGSVFYGEFQDNQRHGFGIIVWPDGKKYVGEFKGDLFDGDGYVTLDDVPLLEWSGLWESGQIVEMKSVPILVKKLSEQSRQFENGLP